MDEILKPINTNKHVRTRIQKFEDLSSKTTGKLNGKGIVEINDEVSESQPLMITTAVEEQKNASTSKTDLHLQPVSTNTKPNRDSTIFLDQSYLKSGSDSTTTITNLAVDAREILRNQPSFEDLKAVLRYFQYGIEGKHDFNIQVTSPTSAQILNVLVTSTLPDVKPNLNQSHLSTDEAEIKKTLNQCLFSTAGIGALLAQIRQLSIAQNAKTHHIRLTTALEVLSEILRGSRTLLNFLHQTMRLYKQEAKRRLAWQELNNFVAGGRILGTVAQAFSSTALELLDQELSWIANGSDYVMWLARNICTAAINLDSSDKESWNLLVQCLKRGLNLGHREKFVHQLYSGLLLGQRAHWTPLHQLLQNISLQEQKIVFDAILIDLSKTYFGGSSTLGFINESSVSQTISAAAALIAGLVKHNEELEIHLEEWLVVANTSYATIDLASRRALVAVLASSEDKLERILERSLSNFSDKLNIQHASLLQQDAYTQTILLAVGYLKRQKLSILKQSHISSLVMRSVTNRLAAHVPHSRFLGMLVGVAVSKAVDAADKVLDFGVEEMEGEEAGKWLQLSEVEDKLATDFQPALLLALTPTVTQHVKRRKVPGKPQEKMQALPKVKVTSIEEISADDSDDDDDLIPYSKPDSDPEDSDEDPTLVDRSKPSAPVYIVDLIKQLQTSDKPDLVELALKTAPNLIRRKIGFGSELSDNVSTLTTALINLQEGMTEESLQNARLQSVIACTVAIPDTIAPSLAAVYFEGDFSISQRVMVLSALGLSARELAGFKDESVLVTTDLQFPSKRLPAHLEPVQPKSLQPQRQDPISALTLDQARSSIQPMALAAADKMTGPSILKIRTFSSRMDVERRTKERTKARTKAIPKNLHALLVNAFFLPLCCRMSLLMTSSYQMNELNTTILSAGLVRMMLQTLTLILHTLGPAASLHLPMLTHEILLLLTSLHANADLATNAAVLPALLHLLLVLIEVTVEAGTTAQERLITEYGASISELVNWAGELGDRIHVPEMKDQDESSMPWTVLAAGIQIKWMEMGKRFQGRMLGLMDNNF